MIGSVLEYIGDFWAIRIRFTLLIVVSFAILAAYIIFVEYDLNCARLAVHALIESGEVPSSTEGLYVLHLLAAFGVPFKWTGVLYVDFVSPLVHCFFTLAMVANFIVIVKTKPAINTFWYGIIGGIFIVVFAISKDAHRISAKAIQDDDAYLSAFLDPLKIETSNEGSYAHIIFEPLVRSLKDISGLRTILNSQNRVNLFFDHSTLLGLHDDELRSAYVDFLKEYKEKITLFTDIEFRYGDIGMVKQMGQSAAQSQLLVYTESYQFAQRLKDEFGVDFIFGPVLDRRTSSSETTIGARSYGQHFANLQENAFVCMLAFQNAGITAIPKHFPGHPHVLGKDINPHYGVFATQYADASLKNNAQPFFKLANNPFIIGNILMTDHIAIQSVTGGLPYTVYVNPKSLVLGVNYAKENFLKPNGQEYLFISDDLTMLIRSNESKNAINDDSRIDYNKIQNKKVSDLIQFRAKNYPTIDVELAPHALAIVAQTALEAGHSMVLLRGLTVPAIQEFAAQYLEISKKAEFRTRAVPVPLKSLGGEALQIPEPQHLPFSKINTVNDEFHSLNLRGILGDVFYMASCHARDDVAIAFGFMEEGHSLDKDYFSKNMVILRDATLTTRVRGKQTRIKKMLEEKQFEYYVVALSNRGALPYFKELYLYLKEKNQLDRLVVFLCNTPDMLVDVQKYFDSDFKDDVYNSINIFCLYENSHRVKYYLLKAMEQSPNLASVFPDEHSLPIDIPDFYLGGELHENIESVQEIGKVIDVARYSSLLQKWPFLSSHLWLCERLYLALLALVIFSLVDSFRLRKGRG